MPPAGAGTFALFNRARATDIARCPYPTISERTRDGIAAARKRGKRPGRPALDRETVSAAQALVEAGLTAGQAAKQLDIGRATAYRITRTVR